MAFALVGATVTAFAAGAGGSIAAPAAAHTTGNLLVVNVGWETAGVTVTSVTDTAGNVYIPSGPVRTSSAVAMGGQQWHCLVATGNAANVVTATFSSAAPTFRSIHVAEWSHVGLVALDTVDWANGGAANTTLSMTVRPTALAVGSNLIYLASHSFAPTAHTNSVGGLTNGAESATEMQQWYLVQTGAAALPLTFTYASDNTTFNWSVFREIAAPIITQHPSSVPKQVGDTLYLDVLATPSSGSLTYQWQDNSGGPFANIGGETQQFLVVPALTIGMHTRQYRVNVTDLLGTTTSNVFALAVSDRADDDYWLRDVPSDSDPNDVRLYVRPDAEVGIAGTVAEAVSLSDSQNAQVDYAAARAETLTLADSQNAQVDYVAARAETLTLADSQNAQVDYVAARAETLTLADSQNAQVDYVAARAEAITLADSQNANVDYAVGRDEALTLADAQDASLGPATYNVQVDEVLSLSDSQDAVVVPAVLAPVFVYDALPTSPKKRRKKEEEEPAPQAVTAATPHTIPVQIVSQEIVASAVQAIATAQQTITLVAIKQRQVTRRRQQREEEELLLLD